MLNDVRTQCLARREGRKCWAPSETFLFPRKTELGVGWKAFLNKARTSLFRHNMPPPPLTQFCGCAQNEGKLGYLNAAHVCTHIQQVRQCMADTKLIQHPPPPLLLPPLLVPSSFCGQKKEGSWNIRDSPTELSLPHILFLRPYISPFPWDNSQSTGGDSRRVWENGGGSKGALGFPLPRPAKKKQANYTL